MAHVQKFIVAYALMCASGYFWTYWWCQMFWTCNVEIQ